MEVHELAGKTQYSHLKVTVKKETPKWIWRILRFLILFGLSVVILYPFLIMLTIAIRPATDLYNPLVVWVPTSITFENFLNVINLTNYFSALGSTVLINVVSALLQTLACAVIGYGFARFKFRGRNVWFFLVILTIIIPQQTYAISGYLNYKTLHLLDNPLSMYLPALFGNGIRSGICIFIFRQFFMGMPRELEEAAYIDGYGPAATFVRVMLPNAGPGVLSVGVLSLVWYWNDYFFAGMYFSNANTVSLNLTKLQALVWDSAKYIGGSDPYLSAVQLEAGCILAILPVIILYAVIQKKFTESILSCGIVG